MQFLELIAYLSSRPPRTAVKEPIYCVLGFETQERWIYEGNGNSYIQFSPPHYIIYDLLYRTATLASKQTHKLTFLVKSAKVMLQTEYMWFE